MFTAQPKFTELTEEDEINFDRINKDSVYLTHDDDVPKSLDKNGKYFFAVVTENQLDIDARDKVAVDTFTSPWYNPYAIKEKLLSLFPNSKVEFIPQ